MVEDDKIRYQKEMEIYTANSEKNMSESSSQGESMTEDEEPSPSKVSEKKQSAYILFCKQQRSVIKLENPEMKASDVTKILASNLKSISDDEKKMFKN
jgi:hypothetical protein